ncbi:unnamed protein product [Discula destructiva]
MSFFKKLKEEFGGSSSSEQAHSSQGQGYNQYPPQDQYSHPQQPPYGQHPAQYGSRDPYGQQQPSYNQPPPQQQQYGGAPAGYGPRPGDDPSRPPIPGQWVPLFSEQHQRWYFVETTGRSLWDAPVYIAPQAPMPAYGDYAGARGGGAGGYAAGPPAGGEYRGEGGYGYEQQKPVEEDHDKRNMLLAAGGALAVGAIGGAVIAEALDDDEDEERRAAAAAAAAPPLEPTPMPNGGLDADGNPISEDDRESIAEAREEYQEELADSDASASDIEEAREEYQEEVDDAYYEE